MSPFTTTNCIIFLTAATIAVASADRVFLSATSSSFVPPAAPTIVSSSSEGPTATIDARHIAVATGYGTFQTNNNNAISPTTTLWAKKKAKKAAGGATKVQVKLLKDIPGTGQRGEVINVTPAFFQNKLRPTKSAEVVSDEEVEKEQAAKKAEEDATRAAATAVQEKIKDMTLKVTRKAGPDGQLFGGVGAKCIIEELQQQISDEFLNGKGVKIEAITDEGGKKMKHDIKHVGEFGASIKLLKDVKAKFTVSVLGSDE
mmetsp:Transcript_16749/g.23655  ORF Transcript_16749/g.23655 Transcript_16749/m.23655 type:complete len:258 (+) Transcript_16749:241-1014(+)